MYLIPTMAQAEERMIPGTMRHPVFTGHARQRYEEIHQTGSISTMLRGWATGELIDAMEAWRLTGMTAFEQYRGAFLSGCIGLYRRDGLTGGVWAIHANGTIRVTTYFPPRTSPRQRFAPDRNR